MDSVFGQNVQQALPIGEPNALMPVWEQSSGVPTADTH